jgi:hypothetical protein
MIVISVLHSIARLQSNSMKFEDGKKIAIVSVGIFLFISAILAYGNKFGKMPTDGASIGRLQAANWGRWVLLVIALYGVLRMITS